MATREDEFDLDFGNFDEFDFGDPFGDGPSPKDDRNPATKFAGGFLKGVQDTAKKPSTYVDFMRKALPDGYSAAYDVVDDVAGKGLGLYNEVVTDLRPAMRDLKRIMYRAKSAVDSVLPDTLSKKLDSWLKDKEQESRQDRNVDPNELKIATDLAEIFKVQAQDKAEDDKENLLHQAVETKRHRTQTEQLDDIRVSLKQLASYQDSITYAYQRKSLELQYRQFYAQRDLLEVTKAGTQESVSLLRHIQKNTGLPDIQKELTGEMATRLTKERLFGVVQDRIAPFAREFLNPFFKNLSNRIKEKTSEFADIASMTAMGLEQASEMSDMAAEFGSSKEEEAGKAVGGGLTGVAARWVGKKLRPAFEKDPRIVAGGFKAGYLAENYDLLLKERLEEYSPTNPIMQMLHESAVDALRIRRGTKVGYDDISRATERSTWDNIQRKTLIEVIPGFLARLLQSSEGIRTGTNAPLTTYDHKTNKFMTVNQLASNIRTQAIDQYNMDRIANRTNEVIDKMDPTKSIDPELRQKLQMFLIKQAQQGKGFSTDAFTDDYKLTSAGFNYQEAETIAEAVRMALDTDIDGKAAFTPEAQKLQRDIARDIRSLRELIPSVYEFANINANTANREAVRLSGIATDVRGEDHVNDKFLIQRMQQYLRGERDETAAAEVFTDSTGLPTVNRAGRNTGGGRINIDGVVEAINQSKTITQTLLQEFKKATESISERTDTRSEFDRLIDVVRQESSRESTLEASRTLREILEIVDSIRAEGVATSGPTIVEDSKEARNWKRVSKLGRGVKGVFNTLVKKPVSSLWNLGGGYAKGVKGVLGSGWTGMKNVGSALFDPLKKKFQDVYVPGYAEPKLRAHLMAAGEYFDEKTGNAIESIRDIKGKVVDKDGNVVLTVADIKRGLMTADGKPIGARLLSSLAGGAMDALGWARNELGKGFQLPFTLGGKAFGFLNNLLRKSPDVFVMGEGSPRLLGSLLRAGHYISGKTGKPIYSVEDIDGDVLDGVTNETILTASDAAKGLVDRWGKPIRTLLGKLTDLGRKGIGMGVDALKWGGQQLLKGFGTVKEIISGGADFLKGLVGGVHIGDVKMDPVVSSVDRIYDLLVKYFSSKGMTEADIEAEGIFDPATGDVKIREQPDRPKSKSISERISEKADALKNRAGSWWNIKQQRKDQPKDTAPTRDKPQMEEKKSSNWFGLITSLIGGLGTSIVGAIKWLGGVIMGKAALGTVGDVLGGRGGKGGKGPKGGGGKRSLTRRVVGGLGSLAWGGLKFAGRAAVFTGAAAFKLASVAASVASSPVVLTAAAVAAAGYVGYRAYRYFKDKLSPLQRVRFSQYGIRLNEIDKCTIVGQLELDAVKSVIWSEGKAINIDSRFDLVSQLERFGVDPQNRRQVDAFFKWYQDRFKPVYLTHLTVLSKLAPGLALHESDDMPNYYKVTYVKASRYNANSSPNPYMVTASPFPDSPLVEGMEIINNEVIKVINEYKDVKKPKELAEEKNSVATLKVSSLPKAGATAPTKDPITDRKEFVTAATPLTSPLGSMINPSKSNDVLNQTTKRNEFVTMPSSEEAAADLANRRDVNKVGDQPQTELYSQIPDPKGNGSWDAIKDTLIAAASALGIDVRKLAMLARLESSFDIYARAKTSSAKGLFQFISSTWRGLMDKYADKFGIPRDAQPTDPKAASILAGQFLKLNENTLTKALGKTPDLTESYLAHFLGAGGSKTFLSADRNALARDVLPKAAAANKSIFFKPDGSPRTVQEVIDVMRNKVEGASNAVNQLPKTITSSAGAQVPIMDEDVEGVDDGRANRSALVKDTSRKSLLIPALPNGPAVLPEGTTTSGITPTAPRDQDPTPAQLEARQQQREMVRTRQIEQQQTATAQAQRDDLNAALEVAKESLLLHRSMDDSLRLAVLHLSNLETLAKAEKPKTETTPVPAPTQRPTTVSQPPRAMISTGKKYS